MGSIGYNVIEMNMSLLLQLLQNRINSNRFVHILQQFPHIQIQ